MTEADAFAPFRAAVMAEPEAQQRLAAEFDPAGFERVAIELAAAHGLALDPAVLDRAARPDPLGISLLMPAPQSARTWPGAQWLPAQVSPVGPTIDWLHFAGRPLNEPFFAESIAAVRSRPFNRLFRTGMALDDFIAAAPDAKPDGLIFHMSRCGSTLVAQMLAASPANAIASEPPPFDQLLLLPLDQDRRVAALRAMIAALTRPRHADTRRRFVKLDAWHVLLLPLFREAFPGVPWVFLYRDAAEVLVSHQRGRGVHTAPGVLPAELFGMGPADLTLPPLDYAARALAAMCRAAASGMALGDGMLVDYRELPEALFGRVLPHFGVEPSDEERAAMEAVTERDIKTPHQRFAADGAAKRAEAGEAVRAALPPLADAVAALAAIRASAPR